MDARTDDKLRLLPAEPLQPAAPPSPPGRKAGKIALLVAAVALLAFGLWATLAPLNRGAVAQGWVETAAGRTVVQHLDGGDVLQVLVREGDRVRKGQTLIKIDPEPARLQLERLTQQYRERAAEAAMLRAEQTGAAAVAFPPDLLADPGAAEVIARQMRVFNDRRFSRESQKSVLQEQIGQLESRRSGLQVQVASTTEQASLIEDELRGMRVLLVQNLIPKTRVLALERAAAGLRGQIGELRSQIGQTQIGQGELRLRMLSIDAEAREQAASRLAEIEGELLDLEDRVAAAQQQFERTTIRAPVGGLVLNKPAVTVGGVVRPGEPLVELVPEDRLVVRAAVSPADIERIRVGSHANVRFSSLSSRTTPRLDGEVTRVSPDVLTDQQSGARFFEVIVEVPPSERKKLGDQAISSGMPVEVSIDAGARTAFQYIMEPLSASYRRSFKD